MEQEIKTENTSKKNLDYMQDNFEDDPLNVDEDPLDIKIEEEDCFNNSTAEQDVLENKKATLENFSCNLNYLKVNCFKVEALQNTSELETLNSNVTSNNNSDVDITESDTDEEFLPSIAGKKRKRKKKDNNKCKKSQKQLGQFSCTECKFTTSYKRNLKIHKAVHSDEKPYKCSKCDYSSKFHSGLRIHKIYHHGGGVGKSRSKKKVKKLYRCKLCSFFTKIKFNFVDHESFHTGERPYSCPKCNSTFKYRSNLFSHKKKCSDANIGGVESKKENKKECTYSGSSDKTEFNELGSNSSQFKPNLRSKRNAEAVELISDTPKLSYNKTEKEFEKDEIKETLQILHSAGDESNSKKEGNTNLSLFRMNSEEIRGEFGNSHKKKDRNNKKKPRYTGRKAFKCSNCEFRTNYEFSYNRHKERKACLYHNKPKENEDRIMESTSSNVKFSDEFGKNVKASASNTTSSGHGRILRSKETKEKNLLVTIDDDLISSKPSQNDNYTESKEENADGEIYNNSSDVNMDANQSNDWDIDAELFKFFPADPQNSFGDEALIQIFFQKPKVLLENLYFCAKCDFVSQSSSKLETHKFETHLRSKRYKCSDCNYTSVTRRDLKRHEDTHKRNVCEENISSQSYIIGNEEISRNNNKLDTNGQREDNPQAGQSVCNMPFNEIDNKEDTCVTPSTDNGKGEESSIIPSTSEAIQTNINEVENVLSNNFGDIKSDLHVFGNNDKSNKNVGNDTNSQIENEPQAEPSLSNEPFYNESSSSSNNNDDHDHDDNDNDGNDTNSQIGNEPQAEPTLSNEPLFNESSSNNNDDDDDNDNDGNNTNRQIENEPQAEPYFNESSSNNNNDDDDDDDDDNVHVHPSITGSTLGNMQTNMNKVKNILSQNIKDIESNFQVAIKKDESNEKVENVDLSKFREIISEVFDKKVTSMLNDILGAETAQKLLKKNPELSTNALESDQKLEDKILEINHPQTDQDVDKPVDKSSYEYLIKAVELYKESLGGCEEDEIDSYDADMITEESALQDSEPLFKKPLDSLKTNSENINLPVIPPTNLNEASSVETRPVIETVPENYKELNIHKPLGKYNINAMDKASTSACENLISNNYINTQELPRQLPNNSSLVNANESFNSDSNSGRMMFPGNLNINVAVSPSSTGYSNRQLTRETSFPSISGIAEDANNYLRAAPEPLINQYPLLPNQISDYSPSYVNHASRSQDVIEMEGYDIPVDYIMRNKPELVRPGKTIVDGCKEKNSSLVSDFVFRCNKCNYITNVKAFFSRHYLEMHVEKENI